MHVERVYLESYRHGVVVPSELLVEVKQAFEKESIEVVSSYRRIHSKYEGWI